MKENKFFSVLLKGLILFTLIYVSFPLNSECLERTVYVVNSLSNTVSVISTDTNTVVATIPVGSYPRRVAFTPDGSKAYVTNYNSNTISVIDVSTHTIIATVPVGDSPYGLAVSPDGSLVYVANNSEPWDTGRPYDSVSVIDTATNTVISMFPWGSFGPSGVAFTPDGKKVWISGPCVNCIQVLNVPDNTVFATIHGVIGEGERIEFLPDGSFAFVSNSCGCCGNLQKISTESNSVVWTHWFGGGGMGLAIAPDGSAIYVGNAVCGVEIGQVKKIDPSSGSVIGTLDVGKRPAFPQGIALSSDGSLLYVALSTAPGQLLVVNTSSLEIITSITVGNQPMDVALSPPIPVKNVHIDIKPGSFPNSINPNSKGKIPVAILSSSTFDAPSQVDKTSLTFGRTGDEQSLAFCNPNGEDVNGDGLLDLICHFETQKTGFQSGDTQGVLKGKTVDGTPIKGTDSVKIVSQ